MRRAESGGLLQGSYNTLYSNWESQGGGYCWDVRVTVWSCRPLRTESTRIWHLCDRGLCDLECGRPENDIP